MKVKVVRAVGERPPQIGHWWHNDDMEPHARRVALAMAHHAPDNWDHGLDFVDYAQDLWRWHTTEITYEKWVKEMWDKYATDTVWWGFVLDLEPEINEFGVVSP